MITIMEVLPKSSKMLPCQVNVTVSVIDSRFQRDLESFLSQTVVTVDMDGLH